jgi:hypothetical protein
MPRTVFFSFHYQHDILRVQVVKQHHVTKGTYAAAGFFDGSLEEEAQKRGDRVVISMIDKGFVGSSVLCVLIGKETFTRRWVHYEIFKAIELGMGVVGIRIHNIPHPREGVDRPGTSPFAVLGYGRDNNQLIPMRSENGGWVKMPYNGPITESSAPYLKGVDKPILNSLFREYDWMDDNGYQNFPTWIEAAAKQAGK